VEMLWFTWWLGDVVGALTITPLILLWSQDMRTHWNWRKATEVLLFAACVGLLGVVLFTDFLFVSPTRPIAYLSLLPILWSAVRFGPRETMTVAFFLSCIAIAGTLQGVGPFIVDSPNTSLLLLESFMAIACITGLALAAAIHERRASENALELKVQERMSELEQIREKDHINTQLIKEMIGTMPMGAIIGDEHLGIVQLNEEFCRMFSIPERPEALIGRHVTEIVALARPLLAHPEHYPTLLLQLFEQKETVLNREIPLLDGRILSCDYTPIFVDGRHRGHLLLYRDITRERRSEKAKSEFMSLASHQLRTPLTAVRWGLSRLGKELAHTATPQQSMMLTEGQRAASRMADTIDTMLKISQIEAESPRLHLTVCALGDLFAEKAQFFHTHCEQKHQSFFIVCPSDLQIDTDCTCLNKILDNLLHNAIKYTPEEGKIELRARREADTILIEVEDTGFGIPAHQQAHVFRKFFRGDNVVNQDPDGTGLGLYLVSLITDALHGSITVQSEEGKGTTFTLSLPEKSGQVAAAPA